MHRNCMKGFPELVSYVYYYKVLKSLNISFIKLGEEECEECELHSKHLLQEHLDEQVIEEVPRPEHKRRKMNDKRAADGYETCNDFRIHIETANKC